MDTFFERATQPYECPKVRQITMKPHMGIEPDISSIQMYKELSRVCNTPRGGILEQSLLYYDGPGASGWCDICNHEEYYLSFENQSFSWVAELIKLHLEDTKFDKTRVDVIGVGCGDGKKEGNLIQNLLELNPKLKVHCHLIDKSQPLLTVAHQYLMNLFAHTDRVTFQEHVADFLRLPHLTDVFDSEESEHVLRVACMNGGTIGNLDNELRFVRDSLLALKPGDLFLTDVMLGFAPPDKTEAIYKQDPRFIAYSTWRMTTESWLMSSLKRYRDNCGKILFENTLSRTTSPIPKTYTIEIHALVESGKQKARFNMLRLHRYDQESFIEAIIKEGFRRMGGKPYGLQKHRLRYLFIRE